MTSVSEHKALLAELARRSDAIKKAESLGLVAMEDDCQNVIQVSPGSVEGHKLVGYRVID